MIFLIIVHLFVTGALIGVILMQKGDAAGIGASQGQGLFTAKGSANVLTHMTAGLATLFFANCALMVFLSTHKMKEEQKTIAQIERQANS